VTKLPSVSTTKPRAEAVTAAATLLLRAAEPVPYPHLTVLGLAPLAAGALLAAPLPSPTWPALRRLAAVTARTMAAPVALVAAMVALARSSLVEHPAGALAAGLVVYYWSTLAYFALRSCTLVARADRIDAVGALRRLRGALLVAGAGMAVSAGAGALAALRAPGDLAGLCVTGGLAALAALTAAGSANALADSLAKTGDKTGEATTAVRVNPTSVRQAMEDELARSMKDLHMGDDEPRPYYIAYTISDLDQATTSATLGRTIESSRLALPLNPAPLAISSSRWCACACSSGASRRAGSIRTATSNVASAAVRSSGASSPMSAALRRPRTSASTDGSMVG